jgi:hypothetical protein
LLDHQVRDFVDAGLAQCRIGPGNVGVIADLDLDISLRARSTILAHI